MERLSLSREVCICHACYKQASRNVGNPTFHPRWKPKQPLPKAICSIEKCGKIVYRNTCIASREQIESFVGQKLVPLPNTTNTVTMTIPLCQSKFKVQSLLQYEARGHMHGHTVHKDNTKDTIK